MRRLVAAAHHAAALAAATTAAAATRVQRPMLRCPRNQLEHQVRPRLRVRLRRLSRVSVTAAIYAAATLFSPGTTVTAVSPTIATAVAAATRVQRPMLLCPHNQLEH